MGHEVATEALADLAAEIAEEHANNSMKKDGPSAAVAKQIASTNKCVVCGDFTVGSADREGKCLYCYQNPDALIDGKPKVIHDYLQAEEVKAGSLEKLMLLYVDTPLSLDVALLGAALDEARTSQVSIAHIRIAEAKLRAAAEQQAAAAALKTALAAAEAKPGTATRQTMARKWEDAAIKGVPMGVLIDAQERLRTVEKSSAFEAEACLQFLATAEDLDPDTLDDAAVAAEAQAEGLLDSSNTSLLEARTALEAAVCEQRR